MATAAFRSTWKRISIGSDNTRDSRASTRGSTADNRRRARSVCRFSHRIPPESADFVLRPKGSLLIKLEAQRFRRLVSMTLQLSYSPQAREGEGDVQGPLNIMRRPYQRCPPRLRRHIEGEGRSGERKSVASRRSNGCGGESVVTNGKVVSDRRRRSQLSRTTTSKVH